MRIRGWGRLQRLYKAFSHWRESGAIILAYHRVVNRARDPLLVCVSPENFAHHLEIIKKYSQPMPLQELVYKTSQGKRCRRAVVVTFDDGYADNLYEAKPLLTRQNIPATVFVTAGMVTHPQEFWWLTLERILLPPGNLPDVLHIKIGERQHSYGLGMAARYSRHDSEAHCHWDILADQAPTIRQQIYQELFFALCPLPVQEQQRVLEELLEWAAPDNEPQERDRILNPAEVKLLEDGGLIEVGSHCLTHPVLSSLPEQAQRTEIVHSKAQLETYLGHSVKSFAYPYGGRNDYTDSTVRLVREAEYTCACSNFEGIIKDVPDSFQLPRFLVRNWSKEEFAHRLEAWMHRP